MIRTNSCKGDARDRHKFFKTMYYIDGKSFLAMYEGSESKDKYLFRDPDSITLKIN